jgi:hypothetical protein
LDIVFYPPYASSHDYVAVANSSARANCLLSG